MKSFYVLLVSLLSRQAFEKGLQVDPTSLRYDSSAITQPSFLVLRYLFGAAIGLQQYPMLSVSLDLQSHHVV